ncbi:DUF2059 domain-containing protein [Pseudaminobacter arsenicus]|uniref:DUF2059 domain-containing protein n=1 Tax=Borborobacter arsenicus TaxID=1851146 RepID=A0A432V748_9HYPH|nr:DUF2059 domain-containing protein [Pseudaminobacter arsenicus]RUM97988.1 DUF2059 domain-containing protein [Pseudaminobacter arsenicus]
MTLVTRARRLSIVLAASAFAAISTPSFAQDISEEHLKAARAAVDAINATDIYDSILPGAAATLKAELIQKNPDLQAVITATVDATTLKLAGRRADLEKEAALAYARVFSIEDLNGIAAFYNSAPGKKLLADGPIVTREVGKAADIWQRGIARDLAEETSKAIAEELKDKSAPVTGDPTPAPDAATPTPAPAN